MAKIYIQSWAKHKGTTLSKLAEQINITQPNMSLLSNGKTWPKEETLDKIAEVLGIEVYQLFLDPEKFAGHSGEHTCPYCGKHLEIVIR